MYELTSKYVTLIPGRYKFRHTVYSRPRTKIPRKSGVLLFLFISKFCITKMYFLFLFISQFCITIIHYIHDFMLLPCTILPLNVFQENGISPPSRIKKILEFVPINFRPKIMMDMGSDRHTTIRLMQQRVRGIDISLLLSS